MSMVTLVIYSFKIFWAFYLLNGENAVDQQDFLQSWRTQSLFCGWSGPQSKIHNPKDRNNGFRLWCASQFLLCEYRFRRPNIMTDWEPGSCPHMRQVWHSTGRDTSIPSSASWIVGIPSGKRRIRNKAGGFRQIRAHDYSELFDRKESEEKKYSYGWKRRRTGEKERTEISRKVS